MYVLFAYKSSACHTRPFAIVCSCATYVYVTASLYTTHFFSAKGTQRCIPENPTSLKARISRTSPGSPCSCWEWGVLIWGIAECPFFGCSPGPDAASQGFAPDPMALARGPPGPDAAAQAFAPTRCRLPGLRREPMAPAKGSPAMLCCATQCHAVRSYDVL